jgi:acyl-CoA synthetase (AMP-forming)/AMP-acid ligase II
VLGQGIVAVLTAAADAPADIAEAIVQSCKQQLPNFMVPLHVELRDELPRTPHGKIDRPALAQALRHLFDTTE